MTYHIKTCLVIILVMMILMGHAPVIFAAPTVHTKASLTQQIPVLVQVGITQWGAPDEDTYVFCDEQDCQRRTTKHIQVDGGGAL